MASAAMLSPAKNRNAGPASVRHVISDTSETWKSQGEAGLGAADSASQLCRRGSKFFPKVAKSAGSRARLCGSESQVYLVTAVWPWINDFASLGLSFPLCEKQNANATLTYRVVVSTKARVGKPSL